MHLEEIEANMRQVGNEVPQKMAQQQQQQKSEEDMTAFRRLLSQMQLHPNNGTIPQKTQPMTLMEVSQKFRVGRQILSDRLWTRWALLTLIYFLPLFLHLGPRRMPFNLISVCRCFHIPNNKMKFVWRLQPMS